MAKKETPDSNYQEIDGIDGFEVVSTDKVWVRPHTGLVIRGKMLGVDMRETDDDEVRTECLIELTKPASWEKSKENGGGMHDALEGDVVLVTASATLSRLPKIMAGQEVVIQWGDKVDIGKGKTTWRTRVFAKPFKGARSVAMVNAPRPVAAIGPGNDDVPF